MRKLEKEQRRVKIAAKRQARKGTAAAAVAATAGSDSGSADEGSGEEGGQQGKGDGAEVPVGGASGTVPAVPAAAENGVVIETAEVHTAGAAAAGAGHGVRGAAEVSELEKEQQAGESPSAVVEDVGAGTGPALGGPPEGSTEATAVGDGEGEEVEEKAAAPSAGGGAGFRDAVDGGESLPACEAVGEEGAGQPRAEVQGSRNGESGEQEGAGGTGAATTGDAASSVEQEDGAGAAPPKGDSPAAAADAAADAAGDTLPNGVAASPETTITARTLPLPPPARRRVLDVWSCLEAFFAAEAVTWECPRERAEAVAEAAAAGPSAGGSLAATPQPSMSYRKQVRARGGVGTCPHDTFVLEGCDGMGLGVGGRCRCRVQCLWERITARAVAPSAAAGVLVPILPL